MIALQANDSCPLVFDEDIADRNCCVFFSIAHFGGTEEHFSISEGMTVKKRRSDLIATCRDINQSLSWNGPIADERSRSDSSSKTILPESLVPRVRARSDPLLSLTPIGNRGRPVDI
jgi:hypothetical protein